MTIEWIVFDMGGVLVEVDFAPTIAALAQRTGWPPARVASCLLGSVGNGRTALAERFSRGQISAEAYLNAMVQMLGAAVSAEELLAMRQRETTGEIRTGVALLRSLAGKYRLACYSNSNQIHWQTMLRQFPFFQYFEEKMASHFCGALKPEAAAFEHICQTLPAPPGRILLIDDRAENVAAARSAGLRAIRFDPSIHLIHELQKHGIHLNETI